MSKLSKERIGLEKGDKILFYNVKGKIISEPEYRTTPNSGLWYATVEWENGDHQYLCLSSTSVSKAE